MVALGVVSVITATVFASSGPVAADQVSSLKTEAAQIARDLVLEQLQIGTYQQRYDIDVAKVQQDEAEIGSSRRQIQADLSQVSRDRKRLQSEVVLAYVNGPEVSGTAALGNPTEGATRAEYEKVVTGDVDLTIDDLHTDENGLRAEQATLKQQETRDQATTNQEATVANEARHTEVQLTSKQSEITGELAVVVAQQQAAQTAAATAAVRAAEAKAAAATARSSASSAASTAGDPSLPPFLRCVLQAESGGNYADVSPGGTYMGGFQFSQSTWNEAAELAGMPQLVNVPPNEATPAEQDDLAIALYQADGEQPWDDACRTS
jgi:hypothetical protein